jgi:CDP-diacylglycerol--serine O-phosphatidyltransferase
MTNLRYIAPNAFTSINYLLGVAAILLASGAIESFISAKDGIILGCHLVVYCVLLDKLDGFAAKLLNASSEFGAQFDSLADLVAFGLAPAFCMFFAYKTYVPEYFEQNQVWLMVCFSLYVLCAAFRLARYNAIDVDGNPDWFTGLPSTLCGGFNVVFIILAHKYGYFSYENAYLAVLPLSMAACAVAMISKLYLPKLQVRKSKALNALQLVGIFIGYGFGFAMMYSELLLGLIAVYSVFGVAGGVVLKPNKLNADISELNAEEESFAKG